jgi:citrate lyase subunit beta / citryl-CoA lyase
MRQCAPEREDRVSGRGNAAVIRSLLYVPASSERFIAKAHERGADAIILDLEDAVVPAEKPAARVRLASAAASVGQRGATVFVRINSQPELMRLDAEAACRAGAFGLLVPKTRDARTLQELAGWLEEVERSTGRAATALIPMVEDAGAVLDARIIATATPRVFGLVAGGEDLATSLDAEPTPEVLYLPKLMVHLAAKAAGVRSFGLLRTVADFGDLEAVEKSAHEARAFGFDGASCVHPSVVPILNRAFSPPEKELDHARRLIAAAEKAKARGEGAFAFEGKMVDEPVIKRAQALLRRAGRGRPVPPH